MTGKCCAACRRGTPMHGVLPCGRNGACTCHHARDRGIERFVRVEHSLPLASGARIAPAVLDTSLGLVARFTNPATAESAMYHLRAGAHPDIYQWRPADSDGSSHA